MVTMSGVSGSRDLGTESQPKENKLEHALPEAFWPYVECHQEDDLDTVLEVEVSSLAVTVSPLRPSRYPQLLLC